MKVIATVEADFNQGPLGTASRLSETLAGETVLRRTLRRLLAAQRINGVHVVVESAQAPLARSAVAGLEVNVASHDAGPVPWRAYVASARKWALDGWRGGISDTCVFDESTHVWVLESLARREQADGVVSGPAAACLIDPQLIDRMIEHFESVRQDMRMTFTQTAPGLSAAIYTPELLADLARAGHPPGRIIAYTPSDPHPDLLTRPCFFPVSDLIAHSHGRCLVDTRAARDRVEGVLADAASNTTPDAATVAGWLKTHLYDAGSSLPAEVDIELTTEDSLPDSTLRPRGSALSRRGIMDPSIFDRLVTELADRDDVRVVLGGFGDPLLHPQWPSLIQRCKEVGIFGIALRTPAVHLDDAAVEVLTRCRVDVLHILLDAASPGTYAQVHRADHFERVMGNIERVMEAHRRLVQPQPLVVCELTKTRATLPEMEVFYDHWLSRTGSAVITGPSHYAGQWPNLATMSMTPASRAPCARVFQRLMVLADGRVTACDQDYRGRHAVGSLSDSSLSSLWTGLRMAEIRKSHIQGTCDAFPLCPACDEWHRP